jgi:hypothetical protein
VRAALLRINASAIRTGRKSDSLFDSRFRDAWTNSKVGMGQSIWQSMEQRGYSAGIFSSTAL